MFAPADVALPRLSVRSSSSSRSSRLEGPAEAVSEIIPGGSVVVGAGMAHHGASRYWERLCVTAVRRNRRPFRQHRRQRRIELTELLGCNVRAFRRQWL